MRILALVFGGITAFGLFGPGAWANGAKIIQVAAAEDKPGEFDGEKLFATTCGWCHNDNGRTAGKGPKLAGITKSDDFILNRIRMGKPGAMPAFGTNFSDEEIHAILAYIRSLKDDGGEAQ